MATENPHAKPPPSGCTSASETANSHGATSAAPEGDRFRWLADHSLEFIGMCDHGLSPFYVNEAGRSLVGLGTLEEARQVKVQDFFFPEDQKFITDEFLPKVLREGRAEVEIRFRHFKTGAALWMIYNVFQVLDEQGRVTGYGTVSRDITERKKTEEALRKTREDFRLLVENQSDLVARMGRDGRRLYVNANFMKLVGKTETEVLSTEYSPELHPDDVTRVAEEWRKTFEPPQYRSDIEARTRDAAGRWRWCSWRNVAVLDGNGEPTEAICVGRDVTELKDAEERVRALQEVTSALSVALTPKHVGDVILAQGMRAMRAQAATVGILVGTEELDTRMSEGISDEVMATWRRYSLKKRTLLAEAVRTGRTVQLWSLSEWQAVCPDTYPAMCAHKLNGGVATPLKVGEQVVGGLIFYFAECHELCAGELAFIQAIAGQAAQALERAKLFEALAEQRRMLADAERLAHLGSWTWDVEKGTSVWSEEEFRIFGLEPGPKSPTQAELVSRYLYPEDAASLEQAFFGAMRTGARFGADHRIIRPDGSVRFVHSRGLPQYDANGKLVAYVGATMDLTERKLATDALRASEVKFRSLFENSPDAVFTTIPTGVITGANPAACAMFGMTVEELCKVGRAGIEAPEHPAPAWAVEERERTGRVRYETVHIRKDGTRFPTEVASVIIDGGARSIVIIRDISRQKDFQAELQRLVDERTARLQELVGELEHFSYTITHDLKAPLRAMRGFAEMADLACDESGATEPKEFLRRIATSAERMDHLIADALNYSRSVRQELPLEDVDAGALLRGMLDSYPELQPSKARIRVEAPLPTVLANQAGLTQVFSNLLGNSVKFVETGATPEVRIRAGERDGWVRFWVEDNGIGIPEQMLPRVFDMFSRGSNKYEGTGIGLALVRKVVQRMGGKVGVESEEGKGSRFWFELRCCDARPKAGRLDASPAHTAREGVVLYVEDEESDAEFMKRGFEHNGLSGRLRHVPDGRAAIDYLSGAGQYGDRVKYPAPALVLLDLNLPNVPGFGVLEWIRNNPDYARTVVVVFSSSTREDDRIKARALGADDFLSKPSSPLDFGHVVESLRARWLRNAGKADRG